MVLLAGLVAEFARLVPLSTPTPRSRTGRSAVRFRLGLGALVVSVGVSACEDDGALVQPEARLFLDPATVDLGRVFVGRPVTTRVEARSTGGRVVDYEARFGPGFGEGLTLGPARARIAPQATETLFVTFDPGVRGPRDASVVFDYGVGTATLTIEAEVVFPPDCEDGNICTENAFDFEQERCTSVATEDACNDLDACTTRDRCVDAICLGESISCDDGNVCTDDFCDREVGCIHRLARTCDDGNPCTEDRCDPNFGCVHLTAENGTPCGQGEACRVASICIGGNCSEVDVPDGTECNDGDPCSFAERCSAGVCIDPTFPYPEDGEVEWVTEVGPLASGAERNPVIDVDGTIFVGVADGVVAAGPCGGLAWEQRALGEPDADSMLLMPGRLVVPFADEIVELDPLTGDVLARRDLRSLRASRTSTAATRTPLDLVIRSSGALVGSSWVEPTNAPPFGLIFEVPMGQGAPYVRLELPDEHAPSLALDRDEALVALLRAGAPDVLGPADERVIRLGPDNLPDGSWSSSSVPTRESAVAIDAVSDVVWTAGLRTFGRTGAARRAWPEAFEPTLRVAGSAVVDRDRTYWVAPEPEALPGPDVPYLLTALDRGEADPAFVVPVPGPAPGATPGLDGSGNVYVVTRDGILASWTFDGAPRFELELPVSDPIPRGSVAVTPFELAVVVGDGQVFGVQADHMQSTSAWFRYRRDNFSTGHR